MISIAIASGELDPECGCGDFIEVRGVLLLDGDGDPICPGCAGPAVAQAAAALQAIYDVVVLDALTAEQAEAVTNGLLHLAEVAERIGTGRAVVRKRVSVVAEPWGSGRPAGVQVDYQIDGMTGDG